MLPLLFVQAIAGQQPAPSSNAQASFALAITVASANAKVGDDVVVTIKLKNTSDSTLYLPVSDYKHADFTRFVAEVADAKGALLSQKPQKRYWPESQMVAGIKPGKDLVETLGLSRLFDLTTPGAYTVSVHRVDHLTNVTVNSNEVTLNIAP
jgi:hypothetical protein